MIKVVPDTNVLLSAMLSTTGTSYKVIYLCSQGKITGYTSKTLMKEFKEVVQRDYQVSLERAEQMVEVYLIFLKLVEPNFKVREIKRDDDDNRVLECAAYVGANYICSWDKDFIALKEFARAKILNPGRLLKELKEAHGIE
ncbi:putative toxin-antitoxin system toxin component, PIN family [Candidatus Micrarchaeota archaeon CG_4_10_14_0_2_um_filter_55_9]|nr:MAG: putative toxin-antitoxin system toxin component, PIN family [Candidatus Micrarchaeota archaeon CG1_02_55_41]PIO03663.1 MAG: putative toxin-antitoxin system toxin component, PIN family [Candidatus Micrarchaeota archaeon CG09_land_8_20_14_0_10_55_25]PIZ91760.1 MAG: putative toxin-antitoxin system toxin component, PIN family [Candidatus Micrarchaeota archaeon CG_4_10_14_0_2_um_filter_55_9]PJD01451.1 MAG: putative toxin-antitoxin system toxin component, PIN family [Candidatus Micrarchaeota a